MRTRTAVTLTALILVALALAAPAAALAVERTVSVEATATVKVPNDSAAVGLGVSLERGSRGAALQAVSKKLAKVIASVQKFPGVGAGDTETGRVSVRKTGNGPKPSYRASEGISVTLHEPAKAGELVNDAVAAGATGVRGPTYFVGDKEAAFGQALAAAFAKAKAQATTLATQAGATLGQALAINEGGGAEILPFQDKAAAPNAAEGESGGAEETPPPTKPGKSIVTATVGVVFALL
jgi:uncharacterized protein YggE